MRKGAIIIIAVVMLLATAGAAREFITTGMNGVYKSKFIRVADPESDFESEVESETESKIEPATESEVEPESEYGGEPEPELEHEPEFDPESESESELESEYELESENENENESESEKDFVEIKPETEQTDNIYEDNIIQSQEVRPEMDTVESEAFESEASEREEDEIESEALGREEDEIESEAPSDAEVENKDSLEKLAVGFTVLSPREAVVKTYAELKSALESDNGITTVYFGDNITMQAGIRINPKKTDIVVVGLNPLDSGRTRPYTLTDIDSASFFDTIYTIEAGTKTIHIRDLDMIGKNYYGPFSVADISGLAGFVITYERVSYDGPQLCHNRRGTVRFVDSSARIHGDNGILSPHQEFSEAKHLIFEGSNTIENTTSTNTVFWHPLGGSFEVADDSSLVVTSPNTSAAFGVFYADGAANKLDITVGSHSVFDMRISGVVAPELYVTIKSFTIRAGGTFQLKTTKNADATVLRVGGNLTIGRGAKFIIYGAGGSSQSVLRQQGGDITVKKNAIFQIIAENPYASLLNLAGSGLICDDPENVLLYNAGRDIVASTNAGRVYVNAQQLNYWRSTVPDGFDFPPLYGWRKSDKSNFVLDGTLAVGSDANFSKVSSNYAAGDPPGLPPDSATFDMRSSRVLAFGRLELVVGEPTPKSGSIEGVTAPGALIRASFTQDGVNYNLPDITADSNGWFHIQIGVELEVGTVIKLKSSWQYLTAESEVTVGEAGSIRLFAPDILEFYTATVSPFNKTVKRLNPDWKIVVTDARGTNGKWSVYARLDQEMLPDSQYLPALNGSLIFVDDSNRTSVLNTDYDVLILEHTPSAGEEIFPILWDENKGILLETRPGTMFVDTLYTAVICWTLVDGV